jgi:DNA-binding transcriptional LysR family regulator
MQRSQLSLKWLEVFQMLAQTGSVQDVATETGLSNSTVSHHLRSLEEQLNVRLIDHTKRPMVLTAAGAVFLRHVEQALRHIRAAELEAVSGDLSSAQDLTLAIVEDFDSEIAPELASILAARMQGATLSLYTRHSHEILGLLRKREVFAGVCSRPFDAIPDLVEHPLLRDPFVVVMPITESATADDCVTGRASLPLLRYSQGQLLGRQIEAQLARLRIKIPTRFELDSSQSIMGLIADGRGWAITTPTSVLQARRFHAKVRVERFPQKSFARYLSLFTTEDFSTDMAQMIAGTLRNLIQRRAVSPALEQMPWLADEFEVLTDVSFSPGS